jgi:hypothetical protein
LACVTQLVICRAKEFMKRALYAFLLTCLVAFGGNAQDERKKATAARVPPGSISVDGRLDEEVWRQTAPLADFVQKEPVEGAPPSDEMHVRIVYDDHAIYIGARMYNGPDAPIQAPMGRRDEVGQAEYLLVHLDTFYDRRTAYAFGVTASGVRIDRYYSEDNENNFDEGFDPVWQARTQIGADFWTAELWIPFSQLRFNKREAQLWGLNVQRSVPSANEMVYWIAVPRTERVWASRFGDLLGIEDIRPSSRIEVLPYVAGSATLTGNRDRNDPFDDGKNLESRTGADFKMGIGPNLTLEGTVNPDFGQVEADPAEVNLTAFETFFDEKRPFFLEGSQLLSTSLVNNFFYSRRIGATPPSSAAGEYVDSPTASTILGAAKLTGRLASGTSLGFLAAVTDQEFAQVSNGGSSEISRIRVAPRTAYGLARVQKELGLSQVSAMTTVVKRALNDADPLAAIVPRTAYTAMGESRLRFAGGEYELNAYYGVSRVEGNARALDRIQRSSVHYLQRPDLTHATYDPTRTSLNGFKTGWSIERAGGRHWLWQFRGERESAMFNTNDMGRIGQADGLRADASLEYRETTPGDFFRNYSIEFSFNNEFNGAWDRQQGNLRTELSLTFPNFWELDVATGPNLRLRDARLTRGGPLMGVPGGWATEFDLNNNRSAQTRWQLSASLRTDEAGGKEVEVSPEISFRPAPRWQLSLNPRYIRQTDSQQYAATLGGGRAITYGQRYVFSYVDRSTWSTQFRTGYTVRPDINIDVYAEPFAASGRFYDFGELLEPRSRFRRTYGTDGTTLTLNPDGTRTITDGAATFNLRNYDFNVRSFRSNVVLRWEWRPGSMLYVVWQQNREASEQLGQRIGPGDMFRSLTAPGSNFLAVKMSFWLPVG